MKRGFTLIELLAVIVILAIILAIAIPGISNIIDSVKQSTYDNQTKLIVDAAQKYVSLTLGGIQNNTEKIITIKDLQDNNYLDTTIKDSRTGLDISDKTWIIVKNDNGNIKYIYGYETNGLVIEYDSINNGGVGIHNDNNSVNKGTWYDLSGNNYNATLSNFSYDSTSGWLTDGLKFDGSNDNVTMSSPSGQDIILDSGASFSLTFRCNALPSGNYTYFPYGNGSDGAFNLGWGGLNNIFIFYGGGYNHTMSQSSFTMTANTTYNVVFVQEKDFTKKVYINGTLVSTTNPTGYTPNRFRFKTLQYNTQTPLNSNFNNIKIYNRALTSTEIQHNFAVDKFIYGF